MNNTETIDENTYISAKGVLQLIFGTVLFPDINEMKAYKVCKCKINEITKLLAIRKYGKKVTDIEKEISRIRTKKQMYDFIDSIYEKYIFSEDIIELLRRIK